VPARVPAPGQRNHAAPRSLSRARDQAYILPAGTFFDVAQGRIIRITTFCNLADWVAQVSA
jgi:hypothetical protein